MVKSTYHTITKLAIRGGFLDGATIEFAPGLNCLIGGRGAGKTTALEFLRYGLGLMPNTQTASSRHRAIDGLVKANLDDGRLTIDITTQDGMRYTVGRAYGETVQVVNEMGTAVPVVLDRDQIFNADVFSQNEIEDIAVNPTAQLELLDRFNDVSISEVARELEQHKRALNDSAGELRRLDEQIAELEIQAADVPVLRERLRALSAATGPDAARLTAAHEAQAARAREAQLPQSALAVIERVGSELREIDASLATSVAGLSAMQASAVNAALIGDLRSDLVTAASTVRSALEAALTALRSVDSTIRRRAQQLAERHAQQDAEYRAILDESNEEAGRATERTTLQAHLARAEAAHATFGEQVNLRSQIVQRRRAILNRASELRDKRFAARQQVARRLTEQFASLRVRVTQDADATEYRQLLIERLRGCGVKPAVTAERLAERFFPTELADIASRRDIDAIADRCDFDLDRARKVIDALRASGGPFEIEAVELADQPCIELKDGTQYKEAAKLSTGQRCTTILPILLLQSARPLLVDQPEDNLDNAFIYETVVKALRSVRGARQIIFVTHNPNIPVLGDAERVFVLASDGEHARVRRVGSVDDCKAEIEQILEGGPEAFLERKARYGH